MCCRNLGDYRRIQASVLVFIKIGKGFLRRKLEKVTKFLTVKLSAVKDISPSQGLRKEGVT